MKIVIFQMIIRNVFYGMVGYSVLYMALAFIDRIHGAKLFYSFPEGVRAVFVVSLLVSMVGSIALAIWNTRRGFTRKWFSELVLVVFAMLLVLLTFVWIVVENTGRMPI